MSAVMNLIKDAHVSQDNIGELQHLVDLSSNNKEEFDYTLEYLNKKIVNLGMKLQEKRDDLIAFLKKYNIEPTAFPVLEQCFTDDVVQDTTAEQNISAVAVEQIYHKNYPNEIFDYFKVKVVVAIHHEINDRIDELKKMKLNKARLEGAYIKIKTAQSDYEQNEYDHGDQYKSIRKDMEDLGSLRRNLDEFRSMLSNTPQIFTSDHFGKMHDNRTDQYSSYYVGKRKAIKKQSDKLQENYADMNRYDNIGAPVFQDSFIAMFRTISKYFGEQPDTPTDSILPTHFVDAYKSKSTIITNVSNLIALVGSNIAVIKTSLDMLRDATGIGNNDLQSVYTQAIELSKSPVNARRIDQINLAEITEKNRSALAKVQKNVETFKGTLQRGVEAIDAAFLKFQKDALIKMVINMGFPVSYVKSRDENLEDTVREKVRRKFGAIPFCDEVVTKNANGATIFVKKSEMDKSGKKKTEVQGRLVVSKATGKQ